MQDEKTKNPPRPVGAVVQALRVLRHLAQNGSPAGVTEVARATETNTSTCFNILRTLVAENLVVFDADAKTYQLSFGVIELALGLLGTSHSDLFKPELDRLAQGYNALFCLWQITDDGRIVLLDRSFESRSVRVDLPVGKRLPAMAGAIGRIIASVQDLKASELRRHFAEVQWQTPVTEDEYLRDVAEAGQRGYGLDKGKLYVGVDSVASVVTDHLDRPRYGLSAITLTGQLSDTQLDDLGVDLANTALRIGNALFRGIAPITVRGAS